uniref:F-box domain-containing protein n=1 Tax=Oryza rufipogon TaxID=4529 RepID=A0A0E0R5L7_ORYRU
MSPKQKSLRSKRMAEASEEDGIDVLPDALLQHILSFLPAEDAVKTCVLSRRWRHLWKLTPILCITNTERWRSPKDFIKLVNHLVLFRGSSPLHKFEIKINSCAHWMIMSGDSNPFHCAIMWVMYALMCQVQVLTIKNMHAYIEMDDGFSLFSRHLTELNLSGLDFRKFVLNFSSCPALEYIYFSASCCFNSVEKILSQSVKYLTFDFPEFSEHHRTHIYAPNLITLRLDDCWGRVPFLESMPSLIAAFVRPHRDSDDLCSNTYSGNCEDEYCHGCYGMVDNAGNDSAKCVLLGGLSEAKKLELIAGPEMETKPMIGAVENYSALVKPAAISKHLKVVKVHCKEVDEGVCETVKFLSTLDVVSSVSRKEIRVQVMMKDPLDELSMVITSVFLGMCFKPLILTNSAEATPRFHFHPHARQPFDGMPPLAPRKRKAVAAARGRKKKERVAPDRISALPDEVLHLVLSLIPVHDAVATCVLARRWLHLWKEAPGLSVEWWDYDEPGDRFISLVDRFFTLRSSSAPLNYCSININFPEFLPEKEQLFVRWIQRALRCQARVLRISLIDWVELPNMTLISQHLTRLELQGISGDDNFLDLSGCPSLVNLNMDTCCIYVDKLSSSSLKTLCLSQCQFSIEYHIWLCFPSLVSLELSYCPGRAPFLESMPSLLQAIVRFDEACEDKCQKSVSGGCDDDDDDYCFGCADEVVAGYGTNGMCLQGLSEATHLELSADPAVYVFRRDLKWCPTFAKLKTLLLDEWCVVGDLSALICFLQHSPILEKLTIQLQKAPTCLMDSEGQYNTSELPFVSNHLKIVEIECKEVNTWVWKILKTLTTYGIPLKQINIKQTSERNGSGCELIYQTFVVFVLQKIRDYVLILSVLVSATTRARQLFDGMPPRIRRAPARRAAPEEVPDRVSALPDEALHAVLSLLPAHDAVRTCVLARRWRHLWEHAPALRVTDVEGWNPRLRGDGLGRFIRFVDGLFVSRRRCDAPLELCDLDFDFPEDKGKDWHVNRWIMLALLRHHARVLRISLPAYITLPDVPLISQRLTRLELDGVLGNDNILDFSCCPALIALKMKCCRINAEKMSSPSVKILSLASCEFYPATRTQMSFPSVVSLELDGCSGSVPFLESMPSLVAAIVRFDDDYADRCDNSVLGDCGDDSCVDCCNYSDRSKCVCLNGLLEATHLELSAEPAMYVFRRDLNLLLACHTFAKLKTLALGEWCMAHDLSALIRFLQQSPILEKLTIKIPEEPKCSMDAGQQKIPEEPFVSNHLKIVEIKCKGKEVMWVCKFLKTLGTFGIPLEKINIKLTSFNFLFDGMRAPARRQAPGGERPDRGISALPDEVLHLVLSLLPAHEAVRTCVLARRWRHLWTDAPGLRVTNGEEWDNPWGSGVDRFVRFVDSLLSLRRRGAPPLEYCDFDFGLEGLLLDKERHVIRWIRRALRCQARVLRISFRNDAELPDMRLLSQHLTRLEICGGIDSDDSFFDLSYCPSLVDLKIESAILIAGRMSSPSLKKLSIIHCDFCSGKRTRMSFPNLASLELGCYYGRAPILERMSSLVEASVRFGCRCEDHCYKSVLGDCGDDSCQGCNDFCELPVDSTSCVCLKGLSEATHLKLLAADPTMYIFRRDLKLHFAYHTFAKLKTLFLNEWCVTPDPSALIWFLQRSPILEKLTLQIQQAPMDSMDSEEHYNSAEQPFASNHLRIVEIECEEVLILSVLVSATTRVDASSRRHSRRPRTPPVRRSAPPGRAMASGADRISDLPEDVLHHVLSLLPSRDAVRTCVLAQRWCDLWRSVPAVRVAGARGWARADAFVLFVDRLLRLRRGRAALDTCDLDLRFDGPFPGGERHGNRWIRRALRRQVRVLRFLLSTVPRVPLPLPDSPLVSDSLTTLELKGVLGNNQVLDFSSCPSLVDLKMEDCYVGGLEMWSPTMRNLSMRYCFFYSNYRARIDFPSLVSFKFNKNLGRTPLLERMPSLATATYLFNRDLKCCSTFSKLKNLVLNAWFVAPDLSALTWFLQYAPLLERLTLKVPNNLVETEGSYSQLEQSFAASHLQIVEIKCKEVHGIILKILEVLNANGIPLEKISIRCSGRFKFVCTGIDSEN